jgi:hypothetical protein
MTLLLPWMESDPMPGLRFGAVLDDGKWTRLSQICGQSVEADPYHFYLRAPTGDAAEILADTSASRPCPRTGVNARIELIERRYRWNGTQDWQASSVNGMVELSSCSAAWHH